MAQEKQLFTDRLLCVYIPWYWSFWINADGGEQDISSTEQFVDTYFETTRRQIVRQLVGTLGDNFFFF